MESWERVVAKGVVLKTLHILTVAIGAAIPVAIFIIPLYGSWHTEVPDVASITAPIAKNTGIVLLFTLK